MIPVCLCRIDGAALCSGKACGPVGRENNNSFNYITANRAPAGCDRPTIGTADAIALS
jgi:hypothetical protein